MAEILIEHVSTVLGLVLAFLLWRRREMRRRMAWQVAQTSAREITEAEHRQQAFEHFLRQDNGPHLTRAPGLRTLD